MIRTRSRIAITMTLRSGLRIIWWTIVSRRICRVASLTLASMSNPTKNWAPKFSVPTVSLCCRASALHCPQFQALISLLYNILSFAVHLPNNCFNVTLYMPLQALFNFLNTLFCFFDNHSSHYFHHLCHFKTLLLTSMLTPNFGRPFCRHNTAMWLFFNTVLSSVFNSVHFKWNHDWHIPSHPMLSSSSFSRIFFLHYPHVLELAVLPALTAGGKVESGKLQRCVKGNWTPWK